MAATWLATRTDIFQIYVAGIIYFGANCALAAMSAFLPTIIKTFGFCKCPVDAFLTTSDLGLQQTHALSC